MTPHSHKKESILPELKLPPRKQTILENAYVISELTRILPTETLLLPAGERMSFSAGDTLVLRDGDRYFEAIFVENEEVAGPLVYAKDFKSPSSVNSLTELVVHLRKGKFSLSGLICLYMSCLSLGGGFAFLVFYEPDMPLANLLVFGILFSLTVLISWGTGMSWRKEVQQRRDNPAAYIRSRFPDITQSVRLPRDVADQAISPACPSQ